MRSRRCSVLCFKNFEFMSVHLNLVDLRLEFSVSTVQNLNILLGDRKVKRKRILLSKG